MGFKSSIENFDFKPLKGSKIRLQSPLTYYDKKLKQSFTVPVGFVCDLASYPAPVRAIFDRLGDSMRPAVVHDWMYRIGPDNVTRADADRIFRHGLKEEGASWFECWASWAGVRLGGWKWWVKPE